MLALAKDRAAALWPTRRKPAPRPKGLINGKSSRKDRKEEDLQEKREEGRHQRHHAHPGIIQQHDSHVHRSGGQRSGLVEFWLVGVSWFEKRDSLRRAAGVLD